MSIIPTGHKAHKRNHTAGPARFRSRRCQPNVSRHPAADIAILAAAPDGRGVGQKRYPRLVPCDAVVLINPVQVRVPPRPLTSILEFGRKSAQPSARTAVKDAPQEHREAARSVLDGRASGRPNNFGRMLGALAGVTYLLPIFEGRFANSGNCQQRW